MHKEDGAGYGTARPRRTHHAPELAKCKHQPLRGPAPLLPARTRSKNSDAPVKSPVKLIAKQTMDSPSAADTDWSAASNREVDGFCSSDAYTFAFCGSHGRTRPGSRGQ